MKSFFPAYFLSIDMFSLILSLDFLSIFCAGTDNIELTVAWYHRMILAQIPLGKKETTKSETWIKKKKQHFLMQRFDCKVGCTCDLLFPIVYSFSSKALKFDRFCHAEFKLLHKLR